MFTHKPFYDLCSSADFVGRNIMSILSCHHSDVIMNAIASQITGVSIVCPTVCSGADQRISSNLRDTWLSEGNAPVPRGFPSQKTSNEENVTI